MLKIQTKSEPVNENQKETEQNRIPHHPWT